jgi:hypothetical protein
VVRWRLVHDAGFGDRVVHELAVNIARRDEEKPQKRRSRETTSGIETAAALTGSASEE